MRNTDLRYSDVLAQELRRGSHVAQHAAALERQAISPGQRATARVYQQPVSHVLRVDVDIKHRRVRTRRISTVSGEAYYDHEAKAKRATRVHLIAGHVDIVEPQEFVMAAFNTAAGNTARLHAIGGHGQITITDVPLSAVVRVEKLR